MSINLLPFKQQPCLAQIKYVKKIFYFGLIFSAFTLLSAYVFYCVSSYHIQQDISLLQSQALQQESSANKAAILNKQITEMQHKIALFTNDQDTIIKLREFLSLLPRIMPDDLYLVDLSWHEYTGMIYGHAKNNSVIMDFLNALKQNHDFNSELIHARHLQEQAFESTMQFKIGFYEYD